MIKKSKVVRKRGGGLYRPHPPLVSCKCVGALLYNTNTFFSFFKGFGALARLLRCISAPYIFKKGLYPPKTLIFDNRIFLVETWTQTRTLDKTSKESDPELGIKKNEK